MAYQDDFRNKVIAALKAKNLAVDISQEATQQAIVEEAQIVAQSESRPMSPEEMKQVLQDVVSQLATENSQAFSAQNYDFTAYTNQQAGGGPGNYPGGGFALSTASKDIMIIPTAGTAGTVNTLSQIDFKFIYNPAAYGVNDPNEVKSSIFNWAERITGTTYDTPVLGIGGAWNGVSYTPNPGYGIGASQGSGVGGSIYTNLGRGNIIFFKPAISTINAALFNDVGLDSTAASYYFSITGYNSATPNVNPSAGFAISFGGIGGSGPIGISGAPTISQYNQIRFLSPLTIANSTATDTLLLSLSNTVGGAAGTQNFVGNGTTQQYVLSSNQNVFAGGDIFYASGAGHTHLTRLPIGGNNTYLTSNGTVPSWTGSIAANTVAVNAATGATILYPLLNNIAGSGAAISTDIDFSVDPGNNILRYTSGSFYVGTAVSAPTHTGSGSLVTYTSPATVIIRPGTDAVNSVLVQSSTGGTILYVNTTSSRVGINTSPGYALDVNGDTNLVGGSVYRIAGTSVLSSTTLGSSVVSSSLTSVGTIATGTWSATAITAFYGGTGQVTYAVGDILYANTTSTLTKLTVGTLNQILTSTGSIPQWVAPATVSVGLATTASNIYVAANTSAADQFITFTYGTGTGPGGIGLSVTNTGSQLTYNPSTQQLKVAFITGTAFTATNLTGTLLTASQPNITTVGTIGTGIWQGTAVGTTYGGTGSNLGGAIGSSNKLISTGTIANGYAATLIDGANSGYLLAANGNGTAPSFVNSTAAAFTFSSGTLSINNAAITSGTVSNTPTNATDLVNKSYADSLSGGLDPHASVRLTTISAIGGSYRQAGVAGTLSGLGDYIIATTGNVLIGADGGFDTAASGIALTNGQRVLVKDGVTGGYASGNGAFGAFPTTYGGFAASWVANGIYTVTSYGGAATSGWLLVRATDTDNNGGVQELTGGTFTFVEEGNNYADNGFVCTNDTTTLGPIGFGSTQISWSAFSGGAALINGQGISKTGNTIATNLNLAQTGTVVNANLSSGFLLGGARNGSVGSSSYATFIVDGSTALSTNTFTALGAGFSLAGGQTNRTLTVQGTGNITLDGGGNTLTLSGSSITLTGNANTLTLSSSSTLNFNSQALALTASMGNVTFAGSANPTATTQTIVTSGQTQYQLSSQTNTWAAGDMYYMSGTAFTALTRLALGGTGASVLIRNTTQPIWGTINLASSDFVSGVLGISNGGTNNGSLSVTAGQVVYTDGSKLASTAVGTAGQALISNASSAPSFGTLTLAGGGLSNTVSGAGVSYQFAQYNASGNAISSFALPTANNSVLISATPTTPQWSNGPLAMAYGGINATTANFTANGVVIYDSANTRLASATGLTMTGGTGLSVTGTVAASGGFFIGGNSVVTSVTPSGGSAIYGAVTIAVSNNNPAGALSISGASQTITINGPGTGITGTGAANQVAYYNATRELTGSNGLQFFPTAVGGAGNGLSLNINATTGNILAINTQAAMTAGFLIDADINGVQRFGVDWKGMTTLTSNSALGNTALTITGGRTLLAAPNANYASLNFGNTNANPGAGVTQIGDLWFNGTNLYFRRDATTSFDLLVGSVSGSGLADRVAKWSTGTGLTYSSLSESVAGVGMTLTANSAVGVGFGSTAYLTIKSLSGDEAAGIKNSAYFVRGIDSSNNRIFSIDVAGNLRATTKSFDIPHPTKDGFRLVYGVLEGPEHGVYHRGTVEGKGIIKIDLPDYWHKLVGDQYTIQLTPWGNYNVCIDSKTENYFTIQLVGDIISRKFKNIKVDYIVHGSRLDAPLEIEQ